MVAEELAPEPLCAPEPEGCAALELDAPPDEGCELVEEPAPAAPPLVEPELEGAALDEDEAPPLASFLGASLELDEDAAPEGELLGEVVEPDEDAAPDGELGVVALPETDEDEEPAGAPVEPEPEGAVVLDDEDAPAGARLLSARSQPARTAAPNAMETARARVESFMWPPWLGYRLVSKDQAGFVT